MLQLLSTEDTMNESVEIRVAALAAGGTSDQTVNAWKMNNVCPNIETKGKGNRLHLAAISMSKAAIGERMYE
jgi:hypothetical protein